MNAFINVYYYFGRLTHLWSMRTWSWGA